MIYKEKVLLAVSVFEVSGKFIFDLMKNQRNPERVWDILPRFTINTNKNANNSITEARYHLQFVPSENNKEKYLLFDLNTSDELLNEEISNSGEEYLFKGFDFKKMLSFFTPGTEEDITKHSLRTSNYIIVELTYNTYEDYYSGGYETDMDIDMTGYLDNNMSFTHFDMLDDSKKYNI
jgi:hypothetical protein